MLYIFALNRSLLDYLFPLVIGLLALFRYLFPPCDWLICDGHTIAFFNFYVNKIPKNRVFTGFFENYSFQNPGIFSEIITQICRKTGAPPNTHHRLNFPDSASSPPPSQPPQTQNLHLAPLRPLIFHILSTYPHSRPHNPRQNPIISPHTPRDPPGSQFSRIEWSRNPYPPGTQPPQPLAARNPRLCRLPSLLLCRHKIYAYRGVYSRKLAETLWGTTFSQI